MKSGGRQQLWTQLNEVRRDWVSQPPVLVEVSKAQIRRVERLDFDGLPEGSNWRPARSPCGFTSPTRPSGNWRPSPRLSAGIVAKTVDHLPLHRQEKIFERHGVEISRKTMGGWMGQCADLLKPLYGSLREVLAPACNIPADQRKANTNGSQRSQSATLPEILAFFSISKHFLTSIFRLRAA